MKLVGIVGGMGWRASATYYQVLNQVVQRELGGWHSARVLLDSLDFHSIASAETKDEYREVCATLVASAQRLESAGAEVIALACNTVHRFADEISRNISVPLLHIADVCGAAIAAEGHTRIALWGTRATLQSPAYRQRLSAQGLSVQLPSHEERDALNTCIEQDLTTNASPERALATLRPLEEKMAERGCSAILLACTDFSAAYAKSGARRIPGALPLYDSAALHAEALAHMALA